MQLTAAAALLIACLVFGPGAPWVVVPLGFLAFVLLS